jgi:hypothetical protein
MNHFDRLSHPAGSGEILSTDGATDSLGPDPAIGIVDDVTLDLRAVTATLVGQEAAITAGHRALARMVITRSSPAG